ncbi:MAG TPA: carbonic anhydrase [Candidatus Limnocylindrales bacterium]|nr:carbonic anhydrase [Candidatus Limnocylindrales bacterium]
MATPAGTPEYERILSDNRRIAARFERSDLPASPRRKLAILACMDARVRVEDMLGLERGDAHVLRNAGGLASDDAIRSLVVSQHLLGTEEVLVIGHTGCGMLAFRDEDVRRDLAQRTGSDLDLPLGAFADLDASVRSQVDRITSHPWIRDVPVHGLVYETDTGRLREVL